MAEHECLPGQPRQNCFGSRVDQPAGVGQVSFPEVGPIALQAGKKYYIEALCKEATGGDNLSVRRQLPDAAFERPIPGSRLSPFVPPYPSAPGNLRATAKTTTTVDLAWDAATDDVGVTGYDVLNGTTLLGSTPGTTFAVTGLAAETTYTFTVKAKDAEARGVTLSARIDQQAEAQRVGQRLAPLQCILLDNPKASGPVMAYNPLAALDLPLKLIAWEDAQG